MKLWAGGKYLLTMAGRGPARGPAKGARTNNVRKLLITNSALANDIRFLYFPLFATPRPGASAVQRLFLCKTLASARLSLLENSPPEQEARAIAPVHKDISTFFLKKEYSKK